ncbi:uncharacterized protein CBL_00917 [Carabus blaptoides fortunei]
MFSSHHQCDPKLDGKIENPNQITTYFITNTIKHIAGFNGFFMAGLLSAALSTLSSELNTVGGLVYYDVILKFTKNKFIISNDALLMKIIVFVIGVLYLCIVPFVQAPHVYELTISAGSLTYGVKIGILLLAIFFTKVNSKGVICGVIVCVSFMLWMNIGAHINETNIKSHYRYQHSVTKCSIANTTGTISIEDSSWTEMTVPHNISISFNSTTQISTDIIATATTPNTTKKTKLEDIFFLYRISVFYYTLIVGLSLYSSSLSALTVIGIPYEIYHFGTHYVTCILGLLIGMFLLWYTILPVFCGNLNIKTPYEYFERRFNYQLRLFSTCVYMLHTLMLMPIVLYAPATALSHVTQIPVLASTSLIGGVCILYTTIGGFKTVIWTDTLQATLMLGSCILIAVVGVGKAGGLSEVWSKAQEGGLIHFFDMDPNPLKRITFWTSTLGMAMFHVGHSGSSASALQRYMSVPDLRQGRMSTAIGAAGAAAIKIVSLFIGLSMYAIYFKCDPKLNGDINEANQITSHFVTHTIRDFPGFNGLFMAGLLSAALSTLSSELNTIGGLIYYDILLKFFKNKFIVNRGMLTMKIIILVNGIIYLCIVPFVQSPHVYEIAIRIGGVTHGAKIGIIMLGIFFPKVNTKGLICGVITSISLMIWINIGARTYNINSYYQYTHSTENCQISNMTVRSIANMSMSANGSTTTIHTLQKPQLEDIFFLYRISVFYYALVGTVTTMLVAIVISYVTGTNDVSKIDPLLVSPWVRPYIKNQTIKNEIHMELKEKGCIET